MRNLKLKHSFPFVILSLAAVLLCLMLALLATAAVSPLSFAEDSEGETEPGIRVASSIDQLADLIDENNETEKGGMVIELVGETLACDGQVLSISKSVTVRAAPGSSPVVKFNFPITFIYLYPAVDETLSVAFEGIKFVGNGKSDFDNPGMPSMMSAFLDVYENCDVTFKNSTITSIASTASTLISIFGGGSLTLDNTVIEQNFFVQQGDGPKGALYCGHSSTVTVLGGTNIVDNYFVNDDFSNGAECNMYLENEYVIFAADGFSGLVGVTTRSDINVGNDIEICKPQPKVPVDDGEDEGDAVSISAFNFQSDNEDYYAAKKDDSIVLQNKVDVAGVVYGVYVVESSEGVSDAAYLIAGDGDTNILTPLQNAIDSVDPIQQTIHIRLLNDVVFKNMYLQIPSLKTVVFDLNGYAVDRGLGANMEIEGFSFKVSTDGSLTINDSRPNKERLADSYSSVGDGLPYSAVGDMPLGGLITGGYSISAGGGIYTDGKLIINGGTIGGNMAGVDDIMQVVGFGGGIYMNSGTFYFNGGTVSNNLAVGADSIWAASYGGGMYIRGTFEMNVSASKGTAVVSNNVAKNGWGGGIYVESGITTIYGGVIKNNTATISASGIAGENNATTMGGKGGGMYLNGGAASIRDLEVVGNLADAEGGGIFKGPAVSLLTATNMIVKGNLLGSNASAGSGAGICAVKSNMYLADCLIEGNDAKEGVGGGMFVDAGSFQTSLVRLTISKNNAEFGGGIYAFAGQFSLDRTVVSGNHATSVGGGIYFASGSIVVNGKTDVLGNITNGTLYNGQYEWGEDTIEQNLYFSSSGLYLTVSGALSGKIGISHAETPTADTPIKIAEPKPDVKISANNAIVCDDISFGAYISADDGNCYLAPKKEGRAFIADSFGTDGTFYVGKKLSEISAVWGKTYDYLTGVYVWEAGDDFAPAAGVSDQTVTFNLDRNFKWKEEYIDGLLEDYPDLIVDEVAYALTFVVKVAVTKIANTARPTAALSAKTVNSLTFSVVLNGEYSIDDGTTWQTSPTFTGLSAATEYIVLVRFMETDTHTASLTYAITATTSSLNIVTPPDEEEDTIYCYGEEGLTGGEIAGIVVGSVCGAAVIAFLIYWFGIRKKKLSVKENTTDGEAVKADTEETAEKKDD